MSQEQTEYIRQLEAEIAQLRSEPPQRHSSLRQGLAWLFLTLGLVSLVPAGLLIWANRSFIDPNRYIAITAPLINEPSIQKAITQGASDALFKQVNVQDTVATALPENAQFLAGPISSQVQSFAVGAIGKIVASPQFADLWVQVNERAHARFMQAATSGRTSPIIDVNDVYQNISARLADTKLAFLANRQLPSSVGNIEVVTIPALVTIPHYVALLSDLRWLMFGLAVGLMLLALAVASRRQQLALGIGLGWIAAALVTVVVVRLTRGALLGQINDPVYNAAATTIWQAFMKPLILQTVILSLGGLAIALTAWLAGPSRAAVRFRRASQDWFGVLRQNWFPQLGQSQAVSYLRRHHSAGLWTLLLLGLVLVVALAPLTVASFFGIVVLLIALLVVLEFFVAPTPSAKV